MNSMTYSKNISDIVKTKLIYMISKHKQVIITSNNKSIFYSCIFLLVLAWMCGINIILASCSQPYQLICSSGSFDNNLKVLLDFKTVHWEKQNAFINTYIKKL